MLRCVVSCPNLVCTDALGERRQRERFGPCPRMRHPRPAGPSPVTRRATWRRWRRTSPSRTSTRSAAHKSAAASIGPSFLFLALFCSPPPAYWVLQHCSANLTLMVVLLSKRSGDFYSRRGPPSSQHLFLPSRAPTVSKVGQLTEKMVPNAQICCCRGVPPPKSVESLGTSWVQLSVLLPGPPSPPPQDSTPPPRSSGQGFS